MHLSNNNEIGSTTLGGDAVRLTTSKIITLCITMVTTMLLSRFRTLDEYGTYSQLLLIVNLASTIFMLGLPNSINYFLARAESPEERKHFLSVYYTLSTILSIVMGIVLMLAVPLFVEYFNNPSINGFVYFFAIFPWASIISSNIENILVVYQRSTLLIWYKLLNVVCLLGAVVIIQLLGLGFSEYMIAYVIIYAIFAIIVYIISAKLCGGISVSIDFSLIKTIFAFSLPLGLATVVGTLDVEIDKLLIGWLMDTDQMAIYTNASKELPLTIIATSITAVLLPRLTVLIKQKKNIVAMQLWNNATELSLIFMALMVAGVFTYGADVMNVLYSAKYLPGLTVFRIYTLVLLLRVTYFGIILNANGETKKILWCSIIALILNAVLNPLFYQIMGMPGPALATLISILIITLFQLFLTSRSVGIKWGQVFPWKRAGLLLMINAVFAIIFGMIKDMIPLEIYITSLGESLLLGGVWAGIYVFVLRKRIKLLWDRINNPRGE